MSVSAYSTVFKSSPYVLPLSLELFQQIGSIKQNQFNQGQAKEQANIDALGQLDVMKDSDRQYLNQKINGLVSGINSLGGVDYSDMGVQNQIEGLGSDIYSDNNVITAVSSSKSARSLLSSYENYKTNPKLKGYYSEANETLDKEKINQWLQDPTVGKAYQGPSSATPYAEYQQSLAKAMKDIQADKYTYMKDKGLYYEKETGTFVTPDRVRQAAIDTMSSAQAAQMRRDGVYQFKYVNKATPEQLINKAVGQFSEQLDNATSLQTHYQTLANAAVNDPEARQKYIQMAQSQAGEVQRLRQASKVVGQNAVNAYQNDPEGLMGQLYTNDFVRGLSNIYSYNKVDRSIQSNQGVMFKIKQAEDARQFNLTYNQRDKIAKDKNDLEYLKLGLKYETDASGNMVLKKIPAGQEGSLESVDNNTQNPDDLKVTEQGLKSENQQRLLQIDQAHRDIIGTLQATNPNMFEIQQSTDAPGGWLFAVRGQQDLEGRNGRKGFQLDDLAGLDDPNTRKSIVSKGHLTEKDLDQMSQWYKDYDAITKGQKPLSGKLPQEFITGVEKAQLLNVGLETNNKTIEAINVAVKNEAASRANLNPQERAVLQRGPQYSAGSFNSSGYRLGMLPNNKPNPLAGTGRTTVDPTYNDILNKIKSSGFDMEAAKANYYNQRGLRVNNFGRTFDEKEIKARGTEFQNFIYSDATANGGTFTPLQGASKLSVSEVKTSEIKPVRSGISSDGRAYVDAEITTGSADKQSSGLYRTYLSDKNAKSIGVYTDPYQEINHALDMTGQADNLYIHGGGKLALKIVIKKSTDNLNDGSSQAWAYLQDGTKVPVPGAQGQTGSEAYARAKAFIQQADKAKVTQEDLIKYMIKPSNAQ